jgi:hypothetical protein
MAVLGEEVVEPERGCEEATERAGVLLYASYM